MCRIPKCLPDTRELIECFGARNRTEAQVVSPKNAILSVRYSIIEIYRSQKHVNRFFVDLLPELRRVPHPRFLRVRV